MAQAQILNVEFEELMDRAHELTAPLPGLPVGNPQAPCTLELAVRAAQQLGLSADNMRIYLQTGERERGRLAQSLRNAAEAYEQTDEYAAESLSNQTSVMAVAPGPAQHAMDPAMLTDTASLRYTEPIPYYPVKEAAQALVEGDQGASFLHFADAWVAYQRTLVEAAYRFRPFCDWDGEASLVVEQNFDQQRGWLNHMAVLCGQLAAQARDVVAAHRWAVKEHPSVEYIQRIDRLWFAYQTEQRQDWPKVKPLLLAEYAKLQAKSEAVLDQYAKSAGLPLSPVSPPRPPNAYKIDRPTGETTPEPGPMPGPGGPFPWPEPGPAPKPGPLPDGGLPYPPNVVPAMPFAGSPSMSTTPKPTAPWKDIKGSQGLSHGAGFRPASVAGGWAGMRPTPLQPSVNSEALSRPVATAPEGTGPGRGILGAAGAAGAGGAMAGAGGMGMPMGAAPGGQRQEAGKGKRVEQDDAALYTENRAWTEGIIGRRRV